ncbi:hypothetical protein [Leptospira meyeri]|uniref:hypothetical protein n=1 Tax=Leptospira meyeri TaxID=29508 RepID=UPI0010827ABC|nr:hypothetical protein [Leptospira meyeri]TGL13524.1 hypothetical protein EHQ50_08575 [Leptospira meyeri]
MSNLKFSFVSLFLSFLISCGGGGGGDSSALLMLLGASIATSGDSGSGPCMLTTQKTIAANNGPVANYYGTGKSLYYSSTQSFSAGPSNPSAIFYIEQSHSYTGADFRPVHYYFYNFAGTSFSNREGILAGQHATSMLGYGSNSYHYLAVSAPYVSITTTNNWFLDLNGPVGTSFQFKQTIGCKPIADDERFFSAATVSSASNGLSRTWATTKKINVNIIFLNNSYQTKTLEAIQPALDRFKMLYAQSTVNVALVFSLKTSSDSEFNEISDVSSEDTSLSGGLLRLYTTTASLQDPKALNIYIASEATGQGGLLGIAGGIPGLPGFTGTKASAMTVFIEPHRTSGSAGSLLSNSDLAFVGNTMAHEAGHFLGLFHTSESAGSTSTSGLNYTRDPLIETPYCGTARASFLVNDSVIAPQECLGTGATDASGYNMMFWASDGVTDQKQLTGEQGWIIRRNPLAY